MFSGFAFGGVVRVPPLVVLFYSFSVCWAAKT